MGKTVLKIWLKNGEMVWVDISQNTYIWPSIWKKNAITNYLGNGNQNLVRMAVIKEKTC